jgi:hypothetical protein
MQNHHHSLPIKTWLACGALFWAVTSGNIHLPPQMQLGGSSQYQLAYFPPGSTVYTQW